MSNLNECQNSVGNLVASRRRGGRSCEYRSIEQEPRNRGDGLNIYFKNKFQFDQRRQHKQLLNFDNQSIAT